MSQEEHDGTTGDLREGLRYQIFLYVTYSVWLDLTSYFVIHLSGSNNNSSKVGV